MKSLTFFFDFDGEFKNLIGREFGEDTNAVYDETLDRIVVDISVKAEYHTDNSAITKPATTYTTFISKVENWTTPLTKFGLKSIYMLPPKSSETI